MRIRKHAPARARRDWRSTLRFPSDLDASSASLAILHGVIDDVVPLSQSCELVGTLRGVEAHHIDEAGQDLGTPPLGCEAGNIAWTPVARSTAWPAERYFLVYDGAGHEGPLQPGGARIFEDAYAFLLAKLPPATTQSQ